MSIKSLSRRRSSFAFLSRWAAAARAWLSGKKVPNDVNPVLGFGVSWMSGGDRYVALHPNVIAFDRAGNVVPGVGIQPNNALVTSLDGATRLSRRGLGVDLASMPAEVDKLVLRAAVNDPHGNGLTFGDVDEATIRLVKGDGEIARFDLSGELPTDSAVVFGEVVRDSIGWRFMAIGRGIVGGLVDTSVHNRGFAS